MNIALKHTTDMRKIKSALFFIGVLALWFACRKIGEINSEPTSSAASSVMLAESFVDPDSWYTIGHDAKRTSASNGTITTLTKQWNYIPALPGGTTTYQTSAGNMVADQNNIWLNTQYYTSGLSGTGDRNLIEQISLLLQP